MVRGSEPDKLAGRAPEDRKTPITVAKSANPAPKTTKPGSFLELRRLAVAPRNTAARALPRRRRLGAERPLDDDAFARTPWKLFVRNAT